MLKFFIDKGNLQSTAQLLHDAKRMSDAPDVDAVREKLIKRLREEFSDSQESFNMAACPCIWGPVYCMPSTISNKPQNHVVLNLMIRPRDEVIPTWTFEEL